VSKMSKIDVYDSLFYAAAPLAGRKELDEYYAADSNVTLSEKAKRRILHQLKQQRKYIEKHERYRPAGEYIKRIAVAVLVILSLGFVSCMSIESVRNAVWEFLFELKEKSVHVWVDNTENETEYLLQISEYKEPRVQGPEWTRYDGLKDQFQYSIEYECPGYAISYCQSLLDDFSMYHSNHKFSMEPAVIQGYSGYKFTNNYGKDGEIVYTRYIWNDGYYVYNISSNLPADELLIIAESIE